MLGASVEGKSPKVMLISAVSSGWLIYDMTTATEAPGPALAVLQYCLLALALVALVGSALMYAAEDK
jgi:hypothetical protein